MSQINKQILFSFLILHVIIREKNKSNKIKIKKFRGQDKLIITQHNLRYTNIIFYSFKITTKNGISLMKCRLKKILENKNHPIRHQSTKDDKSYYLSNLPSEILMQKLLYISDVMPTQLIMRREILETRFGLVIFMTNSMITFAVNHLLMDGISSLRITGDLMDNKAFSEKFIRKFQYIPILTEGIVLKNIHKIIKKTKLNRQLSYDIDWKSTINPLKGTIDGKISEVK